MAEGDTKDVKIKITTEGGEQAKSTFASLIESMGGIAGAVVAANQGLELMEKGWEVLKAPIEAIIDLNNEAINTFKQLRGLAATTGQTIQQAEAMQNTFALAGLSTEKLGFAMFRLSMSIEQGGKELTHMGVALTDASGNALSTAQIFEHVRDKISEMGNATERAAEAAKLFGARQARELMPILSMTAAEYERYKKEAEENEAMTVELTNQMQPLIHSFASLEQKAEKVRMGLASMIAVPVAQFFTDMIAIPVVEWLEHITEKMAGANKIAAEAAQGQGGLAGFFKALSVRAFGVESMGDTAEYERNLRAIDKARQQVDQEKQAAKKQATAEDIKMEEEKAKASYARAQAELRTEASIAEALSRIRTGSDVEAVQMKIATNEKLIELAKEHFEKQMELERRLKAERGGGDLTAGEKAKLESARDKEIEKLTLENQKTTAVDLVKAKLAAAKHAADEEIKLIKDVLHERVAATEDAAKQEQIAIDMTFAPTTQKILASYNAEAQGAIEAKNEKVDAIREEIAAKQKLAAQFPQDVHLQEQINDEIRKLNLDRVDAERSANDKILEARKKLTESLKAEADKQAQTGATLEDKALAALEKRGRKRASAADVENEVARMKQRAQETAGGFAQGGAVDIGKLREARQLAPTFGALTEEGITESQALQMNIQKSTTQLAGKQWAAVPAQLQSQVNGYMERLSAVETAVGGTLDKMTSAVERLFDAFQNKFIRALEFQAARQ